MTKLTELRKADREATARRRTFLWLGFAVVLILIPFVLRGLETFEFLNISSEFLIPVLTNVCIAAVFAVAYNMLLGQAGMLSFGHAVYYGLGGYFTMHMMNTFAGSYVPAVLMPLFGGLFGLIFGIIFGSFSTRKAGTVFAMISLGLGELVAASSLIIIPFFGGEEGIEANRTLNMALTFPAIDLSTFKFFWLEFNMKQDNQVYYFAAFWFFIATFFMFWFSRTPAGRMANAVRDNPERVEFVGYNMQYVRYVSFIASAVFAGIAGGMLAVKLEIVTETVLNAGQSGVVLLQAYVGGALYFIGPIVGAFVVTLLNQVVGGSTDLSLLYSGLLFIAVVLFIPAGLTGLIVMHGRSLKNGRIIYLIPAYLLMLIPICVSFVGMVGFFETVHFLKETAVGETMMKIFYFEYNALPEYSSLPIGLSHWVPRIIFIAMFFAGLVGGYFCRGVVFSTWEFVHKAPGSSGKADSNKSDQIGEKAAV